MSYQCIRDHADRYPVTLLGATRDVRRSGDDAWRACPASRRAHANGQLLAIINAIHTASQQTYGSPRIHAARRQHGATCGKHRGARLMRHHGVRATHRRRFRVTTDSAHTRPVVATVLDRQFTPAAPNQAWASDITYVPTGEGWLYLAAVMDLACRGIVGWAMSARLARTRVCDALASALRQRRPVPGVIHHADRGSPYASADYQALLTQQGLIPSMSRKGHCWDNAPMESFCHSLKVEWLHGRTFRTRAEARPAIFPVIEVWDNRQRLHSALGYRSPAAYELLIAPYPGCP